MRERSLRNDKNDFGAFRNGRRKHMGTCVSSEWYQPVPFFFTRDKMPLHLVGQYRGWPAFLICNGPSVASGKYDLSLLKHPGVMTYGVNNGPRTIRPNFWTCVDDPRRFIKSIWLDPQITKFVPHSFFDKPLWDNEKWEELNFDGRKIFVGDCPNVVYFHRNEKFVAERFLFEDTINWGNHGDFGGGRSVMLPAIRILFLLGFRKVYLLGADFKMSENYTYHFDEQRQNGAVKCNMNTYDRLKEEYFPSVKPFFDEEGYEVYNCNPESELKVFPFKDYNEAVQETISVLGDVQNERTYGMYSKPEERDKWKDVPPPETKKNFSNKENDAPVFAHPVSVPSIQQAKTVVVPPPISRDTSPVAPKDMSKNVKNAKGKTPLSPIEEPLETASIFNSAIKGKKTEPVVRNVPQAPQVEAAQEQFIEPVHKIIPNFAEEDDDENKENFERWNEMEAITKQNSAKLSRPPDPPKPPSMMNVQNIPPYVVVPKKVQTFSIPQPVIQPIEQVVEKPVENKKIVSSSPTLKSIRSTV